MLPDGRSAPAVAFVFLSQLCGPESSEAKRKPPSLSFSDLCWGQAMVAYTNPQQMKTEESERLRGERYQIKFIPLARGRQEMILEQYKT